jgi:hypothetical protein
VNLSRFPSHKRSLPAVAGKNPRFQRLFHREFLITDHEHNGLALIL